ncbi:MAG: peptidylprolyl isomerase [Cyanobacteria bacterium J06635_11]
MDSAIQIGSKSIDTPTLVQKLLQYRLLEKFVQETVIDELLENVTCDPDMAYEIFCQERKLQTEEQRQAWCQQAHFTREQMRAEAIRDFRLHQFKEETWGDRLKTFFLQRKDQLDRVIYSLIRTKDKELARELYFRLCDDGESFADVARQYSEGQESQTGGLVGPVELSVPHPTLAKILRVSYDGQLWEPTQIGDWLIIVRCEKLIPAKLDEAMRKRILHEQFQALLQKQMQASPVKLCPQTKPTMSSQKTPSPSQSKAKLKAQPTAQSKQIAKTPPHPEQPAKAKQLKQEQNSTSSVRNTVAAADGMPPPPEETPEQLSVPSDQKNLPLEAGAVSAQPVNA